MFVNQTGVAVIETDHDLTPREQERILAQLQGLGIKGMILPVVVILSHVAQCGMGDEEDE